MEGQDDRGREGVLSCDGVISESDGQRGRLISGQGHISGKGPQA